MRGMKQSAIPRTLLALRSLLGRPANDHRSLDEQACCVRGCVAGPAIVVASRGSTTVWMCPPHAERWLDSDEGFAAENDPRRDLSHLSRFARAAGADLSGR